jgi:hypothetical protein
MNITNRQIKVSNMIDARIAYKLTEEQNLVIKKEKIKKFLEEIHYYICRNIKKGVFNVEFPCNSGCFDDE